jgi:hypothetical protein
MGVTVIQFMKRMRFSKLTFLLIAALVSLQAQCLMACSAYASSDSPSNQNVPPCHRHHNNPQTPAPCSHQAVSTTIVSPPLKHNLWSTVQTGISLAVTPSFGLFPSALGIDPFERTASPPPLTSHSSSALRI